MGVLCSHSQSNTLLWVPKVFLASAFDISRLLSHYSNPHYHCLNFSSMSICVGGLFSIKVHSCNQPYFLSIFFCLGFFLHFPFIYCLSSCEATSTLPIKSSSILTVFRQLCPKSVIITLSLFKGW